MRRPRVEILYFEGCPNHELARALVEQVATQLALRPRVDLDLDLVLVADAEAAANLRFLGSPTVRVDGRDVEPGAEDRREFAISCRVYRGESGFSGQPEERWIRDALLEATT